MPSEGQHISQARSNAQFLSTLRQPPIRHPDWVVTVAFYTALHMIDAHFARTGQAGSHFRKHNERNTAVANRLQSIADIYMGLYLASRRARYECRLPPPGDAEQDLQDYYEPVISHMCSELRITL